MNYRDESLPFPFVFGILAIGAVMATGWIWNVVKIVSGLSEPITAMFIARCVGVFAAPVGAILGFF